MVARTHVTRNVEQIVEANVLQVVELDAILVVKTLAQAHAKILA